MKQQILQAIEYHDQMRRIAYQMGDWELNRLEMIKVEFFIDLLKKVSK